jgi:hypothetical protein
MNMSTTGTGSGTGTLTAAGTEQVPLWRMTPAERARYWASREAAAEADLEREGAFADVQAAALAEVGPKDQYVEAALARQWARVRETDPAGWRDRREWQAKVSPTYLPQLEAAWEAAVRDRAAGIRRQRTYERRRQLREEAERPVRWATRPFAPDIVCIGIWPPAGEHLYRPLLVLLPLSAPGAPELCRQLGLGEDEVPDFAEPFWAGRLGYHGNPALLPAGRALVLGETMDPLGNGPRLPPEFCPAGAVRWTRQLARRPPSLAELRARAEAERRAEADRKAQERIRDKEAAEKRKEQEARKRSPLLRIGELEAQLRDLAGRLEDAEARAQAERLRRELDELLARRRGNGHG